MSEELKTLIRKRGTIKARLTLFKNRLDAFNLSVSQLNTGEVISKTELRELELRLEKQELLLEEFQEVQNAIELEHENLDEQIGERESFENLYFQLISEAKQIITDNSGEVSDELARVNSASEKSEHSHGSRGSDSGFSHVKLPQIELPKYQGNFENWLEFRDSFSSLIHNNPDIPNTSKFHYLRAQLEGSAKQVIQSLQVSKENYNIAWQLLCERYDNTRLLVYNHMKSIVDAPNIQGGSSSEFRKMIDLVSKHIRALESLGQPVKEWDTLLIFILSRKLDESTECQWEKCKRVNEFPTLDEFKAFIKNKADLLETLEFNHSDSKQKPKVKGPNNKSSIPNKQVSSYLNKSDSVSTFVATSEFTCVFCKANHSITNCSEFLNLSVNERVKYVKDNKLCINCMRDNHFVSQCKSGHCKVCKLKHHTLLHYERKPKVNQTSNNQTSSNQNTNTDRGTTNSASENISHSNFVVSNHNVASSSQVLLSTAVVQILDSQGHPHQCRALLDTGSQSNLITLDLAEKLGVQKFKTKLSVMGIGQITSEVKESCIVSLQSIYNNFKLTLSCLILPKLSEPLPGQFVNLSYLNIPPNLKLADPSYNVPNKIDLLLGAGVFYKLLSVGQIRLGVNQPIIQKTSLGWVISGPVTGHVRNNTIHCHFSQNIHTDIQSDLAKFWEIEEPTCISSKFSAEEQSCENIFKQTFYRDDNGRFVVTIPLRESPCALGNSKEAALERFYVLESKFNKNSNFREMYREFMSEYENLNHMTNITEFPVGEQEISYFLPHHGVFREQSCTTKLRVVFDASSKTSSGYSFNDLQLVGPTIQDELISIILRFRQHNVVVCADIEKMYRQVLVNPKQRHLQQILWRSETSKNLSTYVLNTVTYGTASAPFLAIRCLSQLAIDNIHTFPKASAIITHDFYVDDMMTGFNSVEEATKSCLEVSAILQSAHFNLRKWISNNDELLRNIQSSTSSSNIMQFGEKGNTKTLGLLWSSSSDVLTYNISETFNSTNVTKRQILSEIAKIFDPLGLLSPSIIIAKRLLQRLWLYKLSWDEVLPNDLHNIWQQFRSQILCFNAFQIPRQVICKMPVKVELHGFADASMEAYGSCVYLRSVDFDGNIQVFLLISKTKVAPLKPLTIPKLELCGALILVQLVKRVITSMRLSFDSIFLWSDSTITLSWIRTSPNMLQTFVANRVTQIQSILSEPHTWKHVPTDNNPADLLTRGMFPNKLQNHDMWWRGPSFLHENEQDWPQTFPELEGELPEVKRQTFSFVNLEQTVVPIENFSNYNHLIRVMAYCLRFISNIKKRNNRECGSLTKSELDKSLQCLIKQSQGESFSDVIIHLKSNQSYHSKGNLSRLNPFLDSDEILRIGGRLHCSDYQYGKKHPILLSSKHPFTKLLFEHEHRRLLHAGPQLLLSSIRENYWPIRGRNLAKGVVYNCLKCFKAHPRQNNPIMGQLPKSRVMPSPVFYKTGVDYAGPFTLKEKKGRGSKTLKCYVSLFVCFTTKAIHLELVTELTTEAFLAAFRRFVSRRGKPESIFSDNGKNFVGARAELKELANFLSKNEQALTEIIVNEGVNWKFIPPHSPHFGGLWEAGIKSCKYHLKRVMSKALLTFEEFYTTLTQIEAVLNSRPLTPISSDPNDYDILSPAHFLIGRRLTSLPDSDFGQVIENRLSRFQRVQQLQQHFWKRWSKEYISELQHKVKWKITQLNLQEGDMVLIKQDNAPPLQWPMGRIVQVHPGPDGISRVASIKTSSGNIIKRSFAKICVLPVEGTTVPSEVK